MAEAATFSVATGDGGAAGAGEGAGNQDAGAGEAGAPGAAEKTAEQTQADEAAKAATDEQATKDKAEAEKKAADEQAAKDAAAKALLFDSMADLKLPEGVPTDEKMAKEFTDWAKANGFTKVQAQQAADMHLKTIGVFAEKLQAEAKAQVKAWGDEIANDKELGGDKIKETVATAEKFFALAAKVPGVNVARLQSEFLRTGMANHPDMIRVARYIGLQLGEDSTFIGDRASGGGGLKSDAEVLYPNQAK